MQKQINSLKQITEIEKELKNNNMVQILKTICSTNTGCYTKYIFKDEFGNNAVVLDAVKPTGIQVGSQIRHDPIILISGSSDIITKLEKNL